MILRDSSQGTCSVATRLILAVLCGYSQAIEATPACDSIAEWPLWREFVGDFIQADGRVLDASTAQLHSTSEGQSYAMFFALVANDRASFERLWHWSKNNLMHEQGMLPAWQWGRDSSNTWRILDPNSASDADLWFSYVLLEAGRVWRRDDYSREGIALLHQIAEHEVVKIPGLGSMLLPGRIGFELPENIWRFNPSYVPVPVLRRMYLADPHGPWKDVLSSSARMIYEFRDTGLVPDWFAYQSYDDRTGRFMVDVVHGDRGSYDAIRSYMWAGMISNDDSMANEILAAQHGMSKIIKEQGYPAETVHVSSGNYRGQGSWGFSAALLPYIKALNEHDMFLVQQERVRIRLQQTRAAAKKSKKQLPYYDYVLSLFGLGWIEGRYRFLSNGTVSLDWGKSCGPTDKP